MNHKASPDLIRDRGSSFDPKESRDTAHANADLCYNGVAARIKEADTWPLPEDTEVTGHPLITVYVASNARDGTFIAYPEDVDDQDRVTCFTEGMLRGVHCKLAGADCDHFFMPPGPPPNLHFYRDAAHPSRVELPVIP